MSAKNEIERLIYLLGKLPGLGPRSARRAFLHLIKYRETYMLPLLSALESVTQNIKTCEQCGNIDVSPICNICSDNMRDQATICIVESVADLWAIERGNIFSGLYHVLGGTLSAFTGGRGPDELNLSKLFERIEHGKVTEVIIATNATVDGQTTAHYITEKLKDYSVQVSRLAYGIPVGGELDYLDEGTLSLAINARQPF